MNKREDSPGVAALKRQAQMQAQFDLFSTQEQRDIENGAGRLVMMDPEDLVDCQNHTFLELSQSDPRYEDLEKSIRNNGIMEPLIAFRNERNEYELISGHCRRMIASDLDIKQVPVLIKNVDRDEAIKMMITINYQKRDLLPSEKAKSFALWLSTYEKQHKNQYGNNNEVYDRWELLAEEIGTSKSVISSYINLNNLIPELLDLVDINRIHLKPATVISKLKKETQENIYKYFKETSGLDNKGVTPSHMQAKQMKAMEEAVKDSLTYEQVVSFLNQPKANQVTEYKISQKVYKDYFSDCDSQASINKKLVQILEFYELHKAEFENEQSEEMRM